MSERVSASEMRTLGTMVKFFALFCLSVLLCHFLSCHAVNGHGVSGRVSLSRELILSLRSSKAGDVPVNIPTELRKPAKGARKRGRRGGIR